MARHVPPEDGAPRTPGLPSPQPGSAAGTQAARPPPRSGRRAGGARALPRLRSPRGASFSSGLSSARREPLLFCSHSSWRLCFAPLGCPLFFRFVGSCSLRFFPPPFTRFVRSPLAFLPCSLFLCSFPSCPARQPPLLFLIAPLLRYFVQFPFPSFRLLTRFGLLSAHFVADPLAVAASSLRSLLLLQRPPRAARRRAGPGAPRSGPCGIRCAQQGLGPAGGSCPTPRAPLGWVPVPGGAAGAARPPPLAGIRGAGPTASH